MRNAINIAEARDVVHLQFSKEVGSNRKSVQLQSAEILREKLRLRNQIGIKYRAIFPPEVRRKSILAIDGRAEIITAEDFQKTMNKIRELLKAATNASITIF